MAESTTENIFREFYGPSAFIEKRDIPKSFFERGFIKAEVISFDDLVAAGSVADARAAGKARMEGKDYVMQDGDVVEFRHS